MFKVIMIEVLNCTSRKSSSIYLVAVTCYCGTKGASSFAEASRKCRERVICTDESTTYFLLKH